ncbi:hypothetical protein JTE90_019619 [Oedothorax gibbosus]|uniref:Glycoprotein-N-acetylgalactosamine 3-beta-galactosyltransferase 1 n=1 Tax=Oedothorax gibbosus TaxID=931172 RepID=A0AAV6TJW1_9ARAC|nr:hypothetical protein JTE90_019619 [Oedothorax gibbosus]
MAALSRNCILTLVVGMACGFCFAYVLFSMTNWSPWNVVPCDGCIEFFGNGTVEGDAELANELSQRIRVLCWVMTHPAARKRCESIKRTWGKRCNILLFMSSEEDPDLPTVRLDIEEGRLFLWGKTKQAFKYVYEHYLDKADWFMKADDDTYVVVDNLRYMLQAHSPDRPVYFGRKFTKYVEKGYMSGGSGYVLSREALKRFVEVSLPDPDKCQQNNGGDEDLEMGECLGNADVFPGSTSDCHGQGRFFPLELESHLEPGGLKPNNWFWKWADSPSFEREKDCCSDTAISFHYVAPETMDVYESFIHRFRPYGIKTHLTKAITPDAYC